MPDLPDSFTLVLPLLMLASIPLAVYLRGRHQLRKATLPRARVDAELLRPSVNPDDWNGIKTARSKPGAPPPGPRPYDWRHRVPATLLKPGRRPRSGRC